MEGQGRSRKVMESWMVFSHHWIDISGEKSYGWVVVVVVVACRIIVSTPVASPRPFPLDFGFWIWAGLGFGNELGLEFRV